MSATEAMRQAIAEARYPDLCAREDLSPDELLEWFALAYAPGPGLLLEFAGIRDDLLSLGYTTGQIRQIERVVMLRGRAICEPESPRASQPEGRK